MRPIEYYLICTLFIVIFLRRTWFPYMNFHNLNFQYILKERFLNFKMHTSVGRGFSGDLSAIETLLFAFIVVGNGVSSMILETINVVLDLHEDKDIVLNCTYNKESSESIPNRAIRWQKHMEGGYMDVAFFSPPGGPHPFFSKEMHALYHNKTVLIAPSDSHAAILIINNLVCGDQGLYRCWIEYYFDRSTHIQTSVTSVIFKEKAKEPIFSVFPSKIEENQFLTLTCNADVGVPDGNIKILKHIRDTSTPQLVYISNSTEHNLEKCTEFVNISVAYKVSRADDEGFFRCSSQNRLDQGRPSQDSSRISVIYGPSDVSIAIFPDKISFFVGESVRLTCTSDGNPSPTFQWKFNSTYIVDGGKYHISDDNASMEFNIDSLSDNGFYNCLASNIIKGKHLNKSVCANITVREKTLAAKSCSKVVCSFTEKCYSEEKTAHCSTDAWKIIAFVVIALSVVLGIVNTGLCTFLKLIKPRKMNILDGALGRDNVERNYESLGRENINRDLEERNYESLSGGITNIYSTINEGALRDSEERHYESLRGGETHTYTSIARGGESQQDQVIQ